MALPASGALSIGDIAGEFGGAVPHALSEYYGAAAGVPASGTIAISDFYGTSSIVDSVNLFNPDFTSAVMVTGYGWVNSGANFNTSNINLDASSTSGKLGPIWSYDSIRIDDVQMANSTSYTVGLTNNYRSGTSSQVLIYGSTANTLILTVTNGTYSGTSTGTFTSPSDGLITVYLLATAANGTVRISELSIL